MANLLDASKSFGFLQVTGRYGCTAELRARPVIPAGSTVGTAWIVTHADYTNGVMLLRRAECDVCGACCSAANPQPINCPRLSK